MTTASAFVGACLVSFLGRRGSNTPKQQENQKNNQDNADETNPAMSVAVTVTAEAATETAKQKNDEDDDEDESQRHGAIPLLCANLKRDVAESLYVIAHIQVCGSHRRQRPRRTARSAKSI
jgi:hypothetical protein